MDALGKYLPDIDRPNQGVFSWKDDESNWLALRYDLTAPLARLMLNILMNYHYLTEDSHGDLFGEMKNQVLVDIDNFISVMQILLAHIL